MQASSAVGDTWMYVGRYKSHTRPIADVMFTTDAKSGARRLFSLGEDRMLVEYDLELSSFEDGLKLKGSRVRAEQSATPTSMIWHPAPEAEPFIVTV